MDATGEGHNVNKTLYDELEGKSTIKQREECFHNVIIASKFSPHITSSEVVQDFFIKNIPILTKPYHITGLLLVYPRHTLLVLEAPLSSLLLVIESLVTCEKAVKNIIAAYNDTVYVPDDDETFEKLPVNQIFKAMLKDDTAYPICSNKLLTFLHNVETRIFRSFESIIFDMNPIQIPQADMPGLDETRLIEVLKQLIKMSIYLVEEAMKDQQEYVPEIYKINMTKLLKNVNQQMPELVPTQVDIAYFVETSKYEGIIPLEDYLMAYKEPISVTLQSELTQPIPDGMFFYQ